MLVTVLIAVLVPKLSPPATGNDVLVVEDDSCDSVVLPIVTEAAALVAATGLLAGVPKVIPVGADVLVTPREKPPVEVEAADVVEGRENPPTAEGFELAADVAVNCDAAAG